MCSKLTMKTRSRLGSDNGHPSSPSLKRKTSRRKEPFSTSCAAGTSDAEIKGKEVKLKTPKLNRQREVKVRTPGSGSGREDLLCSQHFDSQTVVGWDCNSPAAVRNLSSRKHVVGLEDDGVEDLVLQLIGDQPQDDDGRRGNTPPLLGLWRDKPKDQCDVFGKGQGNYRNRFRKRHGRLRKHSGVSLVSHEVLDKLTAVLNNCSDVGKETEGRNAEGELCLPDVTELAESPDESESTSTHNTSNDLFESFKHDTTVSHKPETIGPPIADDRIDVKNDEMKNMNDNSEDLANSTWSDDELFGDDSFIVHATQIPETGSNKHNSPIIGVKRKMNDKGLPKSKATRYSVTIGKEEESKRPNVFNNTSSNYTTITSKSNSVIQQNYSKYDSKNQNLSSKPSINGKKNSNPNNTPVYDYVICSKSSTDLNKKTISSARVPPNNSSEARYNSCQKMQTFQRSIPSTSSACTSTSSSSNFRNNLSLNRSGSFKKYNSFSGQDIPNKPMVFSRQRSLSGSGQGQTNTSKFHSSYGVKNVSNTNQNFDMSITNDNSKMNTSTFKSLDQESTKFTNRNNTNCNNGTIVQNVNAYLNDGTIYNQIPVVKSSSIVPISKTSSTCVPSIINKGFTQFSNNRSVGSYKGTKDSEMVKSAIRPLSKQQTAKLDSSLSDDILCQLAEPDEILDSQMNQSAVSHRQGTNSNHSLSIKSFQSKPSQLDSTKSSVIKQGSIRPVQSSDFKIVGNKTNSKGSVQHSVSALERNEIESAKSVRNNACTNDISKQNSSKKKFSFKPSQKSGNWHGNKNSMIIDNKSSSYLETFQSADLCNVQGTKGTPLSNKASVLSSKSSESLRSRDKPAKLTEYDNPYSEDLFSDDDLLADNEGLTESEIFAMLDEAELRATQRLNETTQLLALKTVTDPPTVKADVVNNTNSPVKQGNEPTNTRNSDKEIMNYKETLSEKRDSLSGSQGQPSSQGHPSSQGQSSSQGHPLSQGQLSSSQAKYSAEEIEKKKQLALQRRQNRMKESQAQKK